MGSFEFWVGERDAGGEWESVDVTEEPSVARDNKGTFTVFQVLSEFSGIYREFLLMLFCS